MKISVITVCYNSEKTIEETIKSVIDQDHKELEHIIIDGGSIDNTKKIISKYDHSIKSVTSEPDDGIYDAINKGISKSSGEVISILHSNDIFFNKKILSNISDTFKNNPKIEILMSDVIFKKKFNDDKVTRYYSSNFFKPWLLRLGFSPPHPSTFILKKVYDDIGLYNKTFKIAGDFDFFLRCFLIKKYQYKIVNKCSVIMSPGGLSGKNIYSYYQSSIEILKSFKRNKIYSNIFLILLRFPIKIIQFIIK